MSAPVKKSAVKSRASKRADGRVVCIGLTPACQRTLVFDQFHEGEVNRAREIFVSPGGKSVNTGLALALLGRRAVVTGLNGGDTGRMIQDYLAERGATCAFTRTPWPTRTCTTILDGNKKCVTELVEEAHAPTPALLRDFEKRGRNLLRRASMCFICGTLPPGVPENFWARFAEAARQAGVPVLIDSHGAPLWRALAFLPLLAKMNVHELAKTVGAKCRDERTVIQAARKLTAAGATWVLITDGAKPAILAGPDDDAWRITPPQISDVRSPIGSGDCVNAGLVAALLDGKKMPSAVCFGLACGTANARTYRPSDFSPARARSLASACRVQIVRRSCRRTTVF